MLFGRVGRYIPVLIRATGGSMTETRQLIVVGVAVCILLLPCAMLGQNQPSSSVSTPITMQEAVALARAKNPTLLSSQQNLLSVKAQEIQAGLRVNPDFNASG